MKCQSIVLLIYSRIDYLSLLCEEKLIDMSMAAFTAHYAKIRWCKRICFERKIDYPIIEPTGISEPLPIAETFTFTDEEGISLSHTGRLDTLITVVDAVNSLKNFEEAKMLREAGKSLEEEDQHSVADLLVDQVEFSNVTLINKIARHSALPQHWDGNCRYWKWARWFIQGTEYRKFSFERAQQVPGCLKEMRGEHIPETEGYGIRRDSTIFSVSLGHKRFFPSLGQRLKCEHSYP